MSACFKYSVNTLLKGIHKRSQCHFKTSYVVSYYIKYLLSSIKLSINYTTKNQIQEYICLVITELQMKILDETFAHRPGPNGGTLQNSKCNFVNENWLVSYIYSLKFVPWGYRRVTGDLRRHYVTIMNFGDVSYSGICRWIYHAMESGLTHWGRNAFNVYYYHLAGPSIKVLLPWRSCFKIAC